MQCVCFGQRHTGYHALTAIGLGAGYFVVQYLYICTCYALVQYMSNGLMPLEYWVVSLYGSEKQLNNFGNLKFLF